MRQEEQNTEVGSPGEQADMEPPPRVEQKGGGLQAVSVTGNVPWERI